MSSHQHGAKCCHWACAGAPEARGRLSGDFGACTTPTHYYVRVSRAASFTGIVLLHRHQAFLGAMSFTGVGLLHRHRAFLGSSSFTGTRPSLRVLGLSSRVELPKVLDVPRVRDEHPLLSLQACGARPGDMNNLETGPPTWVRACAALPWKAPA